MKMIGHPLPAAKLPSDYKVIRNSSQFRWEVLDQCDTVCAWLTFDSPMSLNSFLLGLPFSEPCYGDIPQPNNKERDHE